MKYERLYKLLKPVMFVLIAACVIATFVLFFNLHDDLTDYTIKPSNLYYTLDGKTYNSLYQNTMRNEALGANQSPELIELYHIGQYFHNSIYYYAAKGTGSVKSDKYLTDMTRDRACVSDFSYALDEIDKLFKDK